jgi:hypothetical protein
MEKLLALIATFSLACAVPRGVAAPDTIPISVRSNHRSDVDVYLLCGDHEAEWLGVVRHKQGELFEIPASRGRCAAGLNFFLVPRGINRGYWVGPFRPRTNSEVTLLIEKYAPLSTAELHDGTW